MRDPADHRLLSCWPSAPSWRPPVGSRRRRRRRAAPGSRRLPPPRRDRPEPSAAARPSPSRRSRPPTCAGTAASAPARIPTQMPTEDKVAADFAKKYPAAALKFEVVTYDDAVATLSTQLGRERAGHRRTGRDRRARRVQGPVARPRAVPHEVELRHEPCTTRTTVEFFQQDGGQVGVPFDLYPSMLWYKKDFFDEAGLAEPPHECGAKYTMPDGSEVDWNYDTARAGRDAPDGRQERARTPPTLASTRTTSSSSASSRSATISARPGAYCGAGLARRRRRQDRRHPRAWKAGWKFFYDGIWKDHFIMTEAQFRRRQVRRRRPGVLLAAMSRWPRTSSGRRMA